MTLDIYLSIYQLQPFESRVAAVAVLVIEPVIVTLIKVFINQRINYPTTITIISNLFIIRKLSIIRSSQDLSIRSEWSANRTSNHL